MHPSEPKLPDLLKRRADLYSEESTDENMQKIRAVERQINRREAEERKKKQ
jgi:hypothetical protein